MAVGVRVGTGMPVEFLAGARVGVAVTAPVGLATGAAVRGFAPGTVGVTLTWAEVPLPGVAWPAVSPAGDVAGMLAAAPAELAGPDAGPPEPDAAAEQP